jgi:hypothetical protein
VAATLRSSIQSPHISEVASLGDSPGLSAISVSILVHCLVIVVILILGHAAAPRIIPSPQYEAVKLVRGSSRVSFEKSTTATVKHSDHAVSRSRLVVPAKHISPPSSNSGEALQGEARRETAALMRSLKFRQIYGFYPGHNYELPIRKSGEMPHISADLFPPNFSQFVVIDIVIDTQGSVADAKIVAGIVDPPVQQLLLSGVRQFKYTPAKKDSIPVPSQLELVFLVPG